LFYLEQQQLLRIETNKKRKRNQRNKMTGENGNFEIKSKEGRKRIFVSIMR
jgi:hypothetical protein